MRRLRRAAAWLVVLRPDAADTGPPPRGSLRPFSAPEPPWWSRRFLPATVALVVLAAGGGWAATRWGPGCHPSPTGGRISVQLVDGECVGYSDSAAQVFNNDPGQDALRTIQERIFAQNRAAEEVWERSEHRRPYLTLVYLGTLTGNRTRADEESYVSEREELEGMATAQYALLKESAGADGAALLRIVVANGGRQMRHAHGPWRCSPTWPVTTRRCSAWSAWWRAAPTPPRRCGTSTGSVCRHSPRTCPPTASTPTRGSTSSSPRPTSTRSRWSTRTPGRSCGSTRRTSTGPPARPPARTAPYSPRTSTSAPSSTGCGSGSGRGSAGWRSGAPAAG